MTNSLELYLKNNIDDNVSIKALEYTNKFPVFLRSHYNLYEAGILGIAYIIMEGIDDMPGIDILKKHIVQIEKITNQKTILMYKEVSRYRRKTLIQNKVSFVIEDGQMYLPFLGLDLKKAPEYVENRIDCFTTSAQLVYLYFLYHKNIEINVTTTAKKLNLTNMTASRALNDLHRMKLITYKIAGKTGRSKQYKRIPDPDYFFKGKNYLKSPIKQILFVKKKPDNTLIAGLDALGNLSMINPPNHTVVALDKANYDKQKIIHIENKDKIKDMNLVEIQIWDYNPKFFTTNKYVDLVSLYASLKDEKDERIEQALEEILKEESWYTA